MQKCVPLKTPLTKQVTKISISMDTNELVNGAYKGANLCTRIGPQEDGRVGSAELRSCPLGATREGRKDGRGESGNGEASERPLAQSLPTALCCGRTRTDASDGRRERTVTDGDRHRNNKNHLTAPNRLLSAMPYAAALQLCDNPRSGISFSLYKSCCSCSSISTE